MRFHNPKNPLVVNKPRTQAKLASLKTFMESNASLKFNTPVIRVGLSADNKNPKSKGAKK